MSKIPCKDCITFAICNAMVHSNNRGVAPILSQVHCSIICDYFTKNSKRPKGSKDSGANRVRSVVNSIRAEFKLDPPYSVQKHCLKKGDVKDQDI
ncbi:MAG: hypothetical protein GOV02_02930 [Candidatus Aenigmarchaeota archaeon]|nr:hypothetical protein [Candidatus Aenigmarchaeota archaeon]